MPLNISGHKNDSHVPDSTPRFTTRGPFYKHELSNPAWTSNLMSSKEWSKITYQFPNKKFHPTLHNGCSYLSILGFKFTHGSKLGPMGFMNAVEILTGPCRCWLLTWWLGRRFRCRDSDACRCHYNSVHHPHYHKALTCPLHHSLRGSQVHTMGYICGSLWWKTSINMYMKTLAITHSIYPKYTWNHPKITI